MAARDPGLRAVGGISVLYASEPYSCTVPARQGGGDLSRQAPERARYYRTGAKEPQDSGRTLECTKHDGYPAILTDVRNGLYPCRSSHSVSVKAD